MELLTVKGLEASYGGRPVLKDLDISIAAGARCLIVGPNGCGKSTLFKAILGSLPSVKGAVGFEGFRIDGLQTYRRVRRGIGFLQQTGNIFAGLSVRENLALALIRQEDGHDARFPEQACSYFPDLKKHLDRRAGLLSGGLRQQLAIAMVLLRGRKLLLLDEPTAGLAPLAAQELLARIDEISGAAGPLGARAIVIIEHRFQVLKNWVSRLVGLRNGKIVIDNSVDPRGAMEDKQTMERIFFA